MPLGAVDARTSTLLPMVETALQITLDAGPVFEETVVVVGLGVVGLLTVAMLQRAGARVSPSSRGRGGVTWPPTLSAVAVAPDEVDAALAAIGCVRTASPS